MANLKLCLKDHFHRKKMNPIIKRYFPGLKREEDCCASISTIDDPVFCLDRLGFQDGFDKWYQKEEADDGFWESHVKRYMTKDIEISFMEYLKNLIKKVIQDDNDHFYKELSLKSFEDVTFLLNHLQKHPKYMAYVEVYVKYYIAKKETDEKRLRIKTMEILNFRLQKVEIEMIALLRFYRLVALYQMETDLQKSFKHSAYLQLETEVLEIFASNDFSKYKLTFGANDHLRYVNSIKKVENRFVKSFMEMWKKTSPVMSKSQIEVNASFLNVKAVIVLSIISDLPAAFQKTARALVIQAFEEFDKKERELLAADNSELVRNFQLEDTEETATSLLYCLAELKFLYETEVSLLEENNDGHVPSIEGKIIKHIF